MSQDDMRPLPDLLELSQNFASNLGLKSRLARALQILEDSRGTRYGTIALLDPETGELAVEAATGVSGSAARRTRYRMGEGITGRVVQSGKPVIVPRVSQE